MGFLWLISLICIVGPLVVVCRFPDAAGRVWLCIGLTILLLFEFAPTTIQTLVQLTPTRGMRWVGYLGVLSPFSFLGWICIWIGLAQTSRWMFRAAPQYDPERYQERGTSLLTLGILGLLIWPLAPFVRYRARRDLRAIDGKKLAESQRRSTQIASRLGWIGSLLLVGGGTAALIIGFVLFFESI